MLSDRRIAAGSGELPQVVGLQTRHVDRNDDGDLGCGGTETSDEADERGPHLAPVVEERKRELEPVRRLPHGQALAADLGEEPPRPLGECLALEFGESLRRAEARAGPADEEDPRQASIRHGSV